MATLHQATSTSTIFPTVLAHFLSLCHILVILTVFQTLKLLLKLVDEELLFWVSKESSFLRSNMLLVTMLWTLSKWQQKCWRRVLRVPWTAWRSNQSVLREINPEYSLEGLTLKLQYFGHLMQRADSLEKTPMLGKIGSRRRRGCQRMRRLDGIMMQWTWTSANFGKWWGTRRPGMPQPMGSQSQTWLSNRSTANIVAKAAAEFKRIDFNSERSSTLGKSAVQQPCMLQRNHLWKEESVDGSKLHSCLILRNCHSRPNLRPPSPRSVSSHQYRSKTFPWQKDYDSLKTQMMVSILQQ